ncbi:MAG: lytic transglycosylase domain-containing protein [Acidobacteriota bacterium]
MLTGRQRTSLWACTAVGVALVLLAERSPGVRRSDTPAQEGRVALVARERPWVADRPEIDPAVVAAAARNGLDPALVQAVITVESGHDPDAVSPRGAVGLMQVLPETAAWLGLPEAADPAQGLEAGCRYLAALIDHFGGDVELALAAYNAGPGAVRRWGRVPPYRETRDFVRRVATAYFGLSGSELQAASLTTD